MTGARTYGGHGEQMAVFASNAKIAGKPLKDYMGTDKLTKEQWEEIRTKTTKGGAELQWPAATFVNNDKFQNIMMAMDTKIGKDGIVTFNMPEGTPEEMAELEASYKHLVDLRDQVIAMGVIPAVKDWGTINKHFAK